MEPRCFDDLDRFAADCESPDEELMQDNYHRLIEPPGSNPDDPDRGLGLEDRLSGVVGKTTTDDDDSTSVSLLGAAIETELLKDDRNAAVRATLSVVDGGHAGVEVDIAIEIETDSGQLRTLNVNVGPDGARRVS